MLFTLYIFCCHLLMLAVSLVISALIRYVTFCYLQCVSIDVFAIYLYYLKPFSTVINTWVCMLTQTQNNHTHTHLQTLIYNKCHISSISHISFLKSFTTQVTDQHQAADVYLIQAMHLHSNNTRAMLLYRNKYLHVQNNASSLRHQFLPCYDLQGWLDIENHVFN